MDNKEIEIIELNNESIEKMIYVIRGKKVMLYFDLARIYGYSTKAFNQQINRNINRFPNDFIFKVQPNELNSVKSQIVTSQNTRYYSGQFGGTRKPPYAFTEQGIYMLKRGENNDG